MNPLENLMNNRTSMSYERMTSLNDSNLPDHILADYLFPGVSTPSTVDTIPIQRQRSHSLTPTYNTHISNSSITFTSLPNILQSNYVACETVIPLWIVPSRTLSITSFHQTDDDEDDIPFGIDEVYNEVVRQRVYRIFGEDFTVGPDYYELEFIGRGSYGIVTRAKHDHLGDVAIKKIKLNYKISTIEEKYEHYKRIYRETIILSKLDKNEGVVQLYDILLNSQNYDEFKEIYLVQNLLEEDLQRAMTKNKPLDIQHIMYKILTAIKHFHSANGDWSHRLTQKMDNGVGTYSYCAPELLLSCPNYTKSVDMWSTGCIFGEILLRKKLFRTIYDNGILVLNDILQLTGLPVLSDDLDWLPEDRRQFFIEYFNTRSPQIAQFQNTFQTLTDQNAFDLLQKLLIFNPYKRLSADQALSHPYFDNYIVETSDLLSNDQLLMNLNHLNTQNDIKQYLLNELQDTAAQLRVKHNIT
ncbi:unnamed protein product [Didymodactylos carnosus]|uniref:Protein kinase domain-containing protein n=1 Tax=Didymodactylos carnosus TaxID=1234261 RepID=A0A814CI81_9BILA|nr:unnamed protein product [Didymodactylos carnosus]CAF1509810.1 unnamed protein product [Didymodactylos carnosus]CAF3719168.1 unnamed protein product [Didymodactylos carnosus]CAF4297712.1 unnamed protein product [Didymodactylos carnosus]